MKQVRRYWVEDVYNDPYPKDEITRAVCLSSDVATLESKLTALSEFAERLYHGDVFDETCNLLEQIEIGERLKKMIGEE